MIVADLRKMMKLYRHRSLFKHCRLTESLESRRAPMDAIDIRNSEAVRHAMGAHLKSGLKAASA